VLSVVNLQIGAAYRNKKDYDAAVESYRALLKVDPGNEKARIGISQTQLERGDSAGAEATLLEAVKDSPGRDVLFSLGEITAARGDAAAAAEWYLKASAADPSWGKPLYRLGLLAQGRGDLSAAATYLTRVLAVDPVSAEAALARASLEQVKK
jgi:tetratricopeptide (TPR) repeat protein